MMEQKLEVTNLIASIINGFKAISNEWINLLDIGLTEYLISQTEKYYFTNTFLHRGDKVVFRDIYYPLTASHKKFKVITYSNHKFPVPENKLDRDFKPGTLGVVWVSDIYFGINLTSYSVPLLAPLHYG